MTIPDSAFLSPDDLAQIGQYDADWLAGYQQGMAQRSIVPDPLPSPAEDWQAYKTRVANNVYRVAAIGGWVNNTATGYNNAIESAAIYLWAADPVDEHNKAS